MQQRDARYLDRMRLHGRRLRDCVSLQAEFVRDFVNVVRGSIPDDKRAAIEFFPAGFERFFGGFERRFLQAVTQSDQAVVGVVIHDKDLAGAADATR